MKRIISFLILFVLLFTASSCQKENVDNKKTFEFDTAVIEIGKTHTDLDGININIKNVVWDENETKLEVEWVNKTKYEVLYGESYSIELESDGEWVSRQKIDDLVFHTLGYILNPMKTQKKVYNLTDTFNISENGKYRLITDCHVYKNGNKNKSTICSLWAEFSVCIKDYNENHNQQLTQESQVTSEQIIGYCGNTATTIYFKNDKSYTFMYGKSVTITNILANLDYDKKRLCKCLPEYMVDTEFGTGYGINITEGYARCDKGQAELTQEQIDTLKKIILWAKERAE